MDFFKLLKTKSEIKHEINPETNFEIAIKTKNEIKEPKEIKNETNIINCLNNKLNQDVPIFDLEQVQFKKGETICVVRFETSILNVYKGYIGSVRDGLIGSDYCLVVLDGINSGTVIKFHKKHLIKCCPYTKTEIKA